MIRFIIIDEAAANEIVSSQNLQSTDFTQGERLAEAICDRMPTIFSITTTLHWIPSTDTAFILTTKSTNNRLLSFDLEQSDPFTDIGDRLAALTILQKVTRTSIKLWSNLPLSPATEKPIGDGRTVVFPFPRTAQTNYRIVLERGVEFSKTVPLAIPEHIHVIAGGTSHSLGQGLSADDRGLRDAVLRLTTSRGRLATTPKDKAATSNELGVSFLASTPSQPLFAGALSFEHWMPRLTTQQKNFVEAEPSTPQRLEGPAGTGKTLCLTLRAVSALEAAEKDGSDLHCLYITHSEATRRAAEECLLGIDTKKHQYSNRTDTPRSLKVTTLQQWCREVLGVRAPSDAELLDLDAYDSKNYQLMLVRDALTTAVNEDLESFRPLLSEELNELLKGTSEEALAELIRHEITVVIKGAATEDLDKYRRIIQGLSGLPLKNDADSAFIFAIFQRYKQRLENTGMFDTDDVVITALQQLDTPIWRRRRQREGFDMILIDESHLFNLNELSLFHHLSRSHTLCPISFAVDRSQAIGERRYNSDDMLGTLMPEAGEPIKPTRITTVFRCAPPIFDLATSITASGATLFTTFENSLLDAYPISTHETDKYSECPSYFLAASQGSIIEMAFQLAAEAQDSLNCNRSEIAIIGFDDETFHLLEQHAKVRNKPAEIIKSRGDIETVNRARQRNSFIVTAPDYVGGLEFNAVIIAGVDDQRVPPRGETKESRHFSEYVAHNRLYVSVSRARFRVSILGDRAAGPSRLLARAIESGLITKIER